MAVNNEFCFSLEGAPNDIFECMKIISDGMSKSGLSINGVWYSLYSFSWEQIKDKIMSSTENRQVVSGGGPYGRFELLDYCTAVIKDMLTKFPSIILNGEVHSDSCVDGSQRILSFEYKEKHLTILDSEYFMPFDDDGYLEYVQSVLPFKKFLKLFSIDPDEFEEDEYLDLITDTIWYGEISEWTYDDFCDGVPADLTERQFNNRIKKFNELNVLSYDAWVEENDIDTEPPKNTWRKIEYEI